MVRPQAALVSLGGVVWVDDGDAVDEGLLAWVVGREGDVRAGVPVLGGDLDGEGEGEEFVDRGDDVAAVRDGEGTILSVACQAE